MPVQIDSTTDSKEAVLAATGGLVQKPVEEKQSASGDDDKSHQDEINEDSETSENVDDDDSGTSDSEDEEGLKDEAKEESKPKKQGGFKKRIDKLTSRVSLAEQEAAHWKAEALKAKSLEKTDPAEKVSEKSKTDSKPSPDNYDSHEAYTEALTDWKLDQREKDRAEKSKVESAKTEHQKQLQSFQSKITAFKEAHEDFEDVLSDVDDIPVSIAVQDIFLTSDNGPELMYELSKNRDEFKRINALGPQQAAREIGKFEARMIKESESAQTQKQNKQTKAPPPIAPVGKSAASTVQKKPDDMSFQEYKKWRATT